jgi:23S rRNA (cytidine2498-2'-O)-methyltransferase
VAGFAMLTCAPGIERTVKADLAARAPGWRLAFSRRGLVTFKVDGDVDPSAPAPTPFARVWARSLARDEAAVVDRVHVFARDPDDPGAAEAIAAADAAIDPALPRGPAAIGDRVLDVVVAAGEPAWRGVHVHAAWRSPHPGGALPVDVPADAPSRAYAKIEQAIAWAGLAIDAGDTALEIGSAPGGAALALARRGVHVIGVDPGAMHPDVIAYRHPSGARVEHLAIKVGALRWEQLPARVDWLLVDVNLAPQVALHEIARLMPPLRATLRGAVITLKLNDDVVLAEVPRLVERIRELGFAEVHLTHLPANRQELCAVALSVTGARGGRAR